MHAANTSNPDSDQLLLTTYMERRSDEAFCALVKRHAPWVFAVANRQLRDRQLAEDATQAVFILLIRRSPAMTSHHQLTAWLFNAVNYTVKNILRGRRRRQFHELRKMSRQTAALADTVPANELAERLDAAVAALAPAYRTAILLRFYQEQPFEQVAESLHISEAAARKRVTRAIDMLRQRLGTQGTALSAGTLTAAAAVGFHELPGTLAQTVSRTALAAKAGAAVPAAIASTAKGAAYLMATAKLKTAVVVAAAALAVIVPATVVTVHYALRPALAPQADVPVDPAAQAGDYLSYYQPQPGEVIKLVTAAPPEARAAMYSALQSPGNPPFAAPQGAMIFDWNGGHPQNIAVQAQLEMPIAQAVVGLAAVTLNLKPEQIDMKAQISERSIGVPGDLVYDSSMPAAQVIPALERFYRERMNVALKLTLSQMGQRPVFTFRGQFQFHRLSFTEVGQPPRINGRVADPLIEIYGQDPFDPMQHTLGSGVMPSRGFLSQLTEWLHADVSFAGNTGGFPDRMGWRVYGSSFDELPNEAAAILKHVAEQTGLELSVKTVPAYHLLIEAAADPLADFDRYYRLKDGEALALVTDAPQALRDAFLAAGVPPGRRAPSGKFIMVRWVGDKPYFWGYGDSVPLHDVLQVFMNAYTQQLDNHLAASAGAPMETTGLDPRSRLPILKGDLVIRAGATDEQYRASLESILSNYLGRPVMLTYREVREKAIVLRGNWQYAPVAERPGPVAHRVPVVDIYGARLDESFDRGIDATGNATYFAGYLGEWLHQPVVVEATGFPGAVQAHFHTLDNAPDQEKARDKALVLQHLAEQTGLTATEEVRPIRHLFIEEAMGK